MEIWNSSKIEWRGEVFFYCDKMSYALNEACTVELFCQNSCRFIPIEWWSWVRVQSICHSSSHIRKADRSISTEGLIKLSIFSNKLGTLIWCLHMVISCSAYFSARSITICTNFVIDLIESIEIVESPSNHRMSVLFSQFQTLSTMSDYQLEVASRGKQAFLSWWVKMSWSDFNDLIWVEINRKKTYFHP